MKRVLMVATVSPMIGQFNMNNIRLLKSMGYEVDVAADFTNLSVWTAERIEAFKAELKREDVKKIISLKKVGTFQSTGHDNERYYYYS